MYASRAISSGDTPFSAANGRYTSLIATYFGLPRCVSAHFTIANPPCPIVFPRVTRLISGKGAICERWYDCDMVDNAGSVIDVSFQNVCSDSYPGLYLMYPNPLMCILTRKELFLLSEMKHQGRSNFSIPVCLPLRRVRDFGLAPLQIDGYGKEKDVR